MKKLVILLTLSFLFTLFVPSITYAKTCKNNSTSLVIDTNETLELSETTNVQYLKINEGASIKAPEGYSLTLTVNGVEKDINEGTYKGKITLTVSENNEIYYEGGDLTHYFRQALYVEENEIIDTKSVLSALIGGKTTDTYSKNTKINSEGECFNGYYISGNSDYSILNTKIKFTGNGGNDFAGYGAAIMATGENTNLLVDNANINTDGAVRTAIIADDGSNLVVKNSKISTNDGELPDDYVATVQLGEMKEVPWMLGLIGNCRATNLLGDNTKATYINSDISAENWGVLSTDDCSNVKLTSINSKISITGESGYGSYAIGEAIDSFYGCKIDVPDYSTIITGGHAIYASSNYETVSELNEELELGLTSKEIKSLGSKNSTVNSDRFGIMWHGNGSVNIYDKTKFNCGETIFLVKGASADINVDGSKGAKINSGTDVIIQAMDNDDPGPIQVDGKMVNEGVYTEPTSDIILDSSHDTTTVDENSDIIASFSDINLEGDFYNSIRGDLSDNSAKNLSISFDDTIITGTISSSDAKHSQDTITKDDYMLLGEVTNTASESINNGVIVSLENNSLWTVDSTSYLTSLNISDDSKISAPKGYNLAFTVDGEEIDLSSGNYTGNIALIVEKSSNAFNILFDWLL
jgi:hypothetical protein